MFGSGVSLQAPSVSVHVAGKEGLMKSIVDIFNRGNLVMGSQELLIWYVEVRHSRLLAHIFGV